jgi:teichuronic acid biosynthesis glycosyltransferase TuaH
MVTLVFVSLEPWDDIWRRNQFLCDGLLRRSDATQILFVQPPFDNSYALRLRNFKQIHISASLVSNGYGNRLRLFTPTKWLPNTVPLGRKLNEMSLVSQVRSALATLAWSATHLWINAHETANLLDAGIAAQSIYDITDDWTKFSGNQAHLKVVKRQDYKLCVAASQVIVCSEQLLVDKRDLVEAKNLHLIPNGVHVDHYLSVTDNSKQLHPVTQTWQKPVFGYTGTIHGDRVDVNLVAEIATLNPNATIAMVGPNLLDADDQMLLSRHSNIVFTGAMPYSELPEIMRAFDVCMVPHVVTPFTESLNPIKLWEYLAAGKPIVSTNVAGFKDFPELVHVAESYDVFLANLDIALTEDSSIMVARQTIAQQHSWDKRIDQVIQILGVSQ